ncbi:MAG: hypothetical protein V1755_05730 [Chloroflexota bacterium]
MTDYDLEGKPFTVNEYQQAIDDILGEYPEYTAPPRYPMITLPLHDGSKLRPGKLARRRRRDAKRRADRWYAAWEAAGEKLLDELNKMHKETGAMRDKLGWLLDHGFRHEAEWLRAITSVRSECYVAICNALGKYF